MFIRGVFLTFSTEIVTVAGNLLVGTLLARALTPSERGIMVLVMTLPTTVASLVSVGLPQSSIYLVGRRQRDPMKVLGNALVIAGGLGLLSVVAFHVGKDLVLRTVLKELPQELWLPSMLLVPALLLDAVALSILCARQRFDLFNLRRTASPLLTLGGFVLALVLFRGGLSGAAWAYFTVAVLLTGLSLVLTGRDVPLTLTFDCHLTGESLRYGAKYYLHDLVGRLNYRIDVYLLAYLLTPAQVAFLGVATSLAEVAWYFPNSVGTVLFPHLSGAPVEKIHQITARVSRNTLALTGAIVAGLLALGWFLIPVVYGPAYRASVAPFLILLPGVMCMVVYKVLARDFTSRGQLRIPVLAASAALVVNIGLDWLLIQRSGVTGAAIASTVGYVTAGAVLLVSFLRTSRLRWQEALLPKWSELVGHWDWAKMRVRSLGERTRTLSGEAVFAACPDETAMEARPRRSREA